MAARAVAVDVGSSTIKVLAVKAAKQGLSVTGFAVVDPQDAEAELEATGLPLKGAVVGPGPALAGRRGPGGGAGPRRRGARSPGFRP